MAVFRAVEVAGLQEFYPALKTRRTPSNVSYLVDNIWEWLRPKDDPRYPSRRFATYASPTPELALKGANGTSRPNDFSVGRLVAAPGGEVFAVQLNVSDARDHRDVHAIRKTIVNWFGQDVLDGPLQAKLPLAPLFLPAVDAEDIEMTLSRAPRGDALKKELQELSTFWADCTPLGDGMLNLPSATGEIFLYAPNGYQLAIDDITARNI